MSGIKLDAASRYLKYLADRFPRRPGAPVNKRHYATIGDLHLRLTREGADGYGDYYRLVLKCDRRRLSDTAVARFAASFFPGDEIKVVKPRNKPNEVHIFARCDAQKANEGGGGF
jgi:hypothetical protein